MIKFEKDEKIIKTIRRHFLIMIPTTVGLVFLAIMPMLLFLMLSLDISFIDPNLKFSLEEKISEWKIFGYSLWLLLLWVIFFMEWTDYYLDAWVITDKRIIDIEQKGFFHREVTSFEFTQIQDITVETRGVLCAILKFGTLHIQTAGHNRNIIINDALYPEDARSLILNLSRQSKATKIQ